MKYEKRSSKSGNSASARSLVHRICLGAGFAILSLVGRGTAQCESQKIIPLDAAECTEFGSGAAIEGDLAVIGCHLCDNTAGVAYVFRRTDGEWQQEAKLVSSSPVWHPRFASTVSLSGDRIAVADSSCIDDDTVAGAVFVFRFDGVGWTEEAKLYPAVQGYEDCFGSDISLDGDRLLIGAPCTDAWDENSGASYVFEYDGTAWSEVVQLVPDVGNPQDYYGNSVSLHGDIAVVGACWKDEAAIDGGLVYVYRRTADGWREVDVLEPLVPEQGALFGYDVSTNGFCIAVGALADGFNDPGAAYVFRRAGNQWFEEAKLVPATVGSNDRFGSEVSIGAEALLVGCPRDYGVASASGAAYLFQRLGPDWMLTDRFWGSDTRNGDELGGFLEIRGMQMIVTALQHDAVGNRSGAAYVFEVNRSCYGFGTSGSGGLVPQIYGTGCPAIGSTATIDICHGLGGTLGFLVRGGHRRSIPLFGGRLLVWPFTEIHPHVLGGTPGIAGEGGYSLPMDLTDLSLAGVTLYSQAAYLDPAAANGVSLTRGVTIVIPGID